MIIAAAFCFAAAIGIIRLIAFARFTAREKNISGAVMLYIFSFILLLCAIFSICRL